MEDRRQDNRRMTSIARRINFSFWLKHLGAVLLFDVVLAMLILFTIVWWRTDQLNAAMPEDLVNIKWDIEGSSYSELTLITTAEDGQQDVFLLHEAIDYLLLPLCILLAFELIQLVSALFHTDDIRRKLRPLNDLAVRAEEISAMAMQYDGQGDGAQGRKQGGGIHDASEGNLEHLEHAISSLSPDASDIRISTGDKDLQSIEVALNNLLARMQESKRQQTRFVSDASHELRTPISVIQGYVNMLDRWGKEDESVLEESIEALKHESEHMKELVEQLLFLARGDSGRNTLKCTQFDLTEVMKEVWEESMMIDDQHRYVYDAAPDGTCSVMLYGDQAMIKQSIRIFVQNAAKYSSSGDVIKLAVRQEGKSIQYIVQDEGIGMQSSDVVHIFERFYRSDEARNENTGGSGLGLSIAKWIVDAHDGTIDVLSRPDFGTRFTVSFPSR